MHWLAEKLGGERSAWMGKLMAFLFPNFRNFQLALGGGVCSESSGNPLLPIEMLLGGKERPHVAVLGVPFGGELELGSSCDPRERLKFKEVGFIPRKSHRL